MDMTEFRKSVRGAFLQAIGGGILVAAFVTGNIGNFFAWFGAIVFVGLGLFVWFKK